MKVNKLKKGSLISRLLSQKDKLKQKNKNLITENKKLNNAFDELEKGLEKAINDCKELKDLEKYIFALDVVLKKVKELRNK